MRCGTGVAAWLVGLAVGVGCVVGSASAGEGRDASADVNVAPDTPPIHLRQTGWYVKHGRPYVQGEYADLLRTCRKADFPTTPLAGDIVKKLGRSYYDIWIEGARLAIRSTSWGFDVDDGEQACRFRAVRSERAAIANENGIYSLDLDVHSAHRRAADRKIVRYARKPRTPAAQRADDKQRAAVMALLKKQGYGQIADEAASTRTSSARVAGQPCRKTQKRSSGSVCVWSGGRRWGFDDVADHSPGYISGYTPLLTSVDVVLLPGDSLILSASPANDEGERLTTQMMTVGKPPQTSVFDVPANVSIEPGPH